MKRSRLARRWWVGLTTVVALSGLLTAATSYGQRRQTFAYVNNRKDGTISQYRVGADGTLSPLAPATVLAGREPISIAADPGGRFLYVVNLSDRNVAQYRITPDGTLAPLSPATVPTGAGARAVAVEPAGRFVYVANNMAGTLSQYGINPDGTLAPLSPATVPTGKYPIALAVNPTKRVVYAISLVGGHPLGTAATLSPYRINADGTLAALATIPAGNYPHSMTIDARGRFAYVASEGGLRQYGINPDGTLQFLSVTRVNEITDTAPSSVALHPGGAFAYVISKNGGTLSPHRVQAGGKLTRSQKYKVKADGTLLTPAPPLAPHEGGYPVDVAVAPAGDSVYVVNFKNSGTVFQYRVGSDGTLPPLPQATVAAGRLPFSIVTVRR